jgi:NAD kinase
MKQLIPAIRQYKHNDGSDGFVIAYDKDETEKLVAELNAQIEFKIKECQELAQACNRYKNLALK